MITIYHLSTSRSERIVWLMEELGLPYKLETFEREPTGAAPKAMKELHALGKAPMIRDGDTLLAESGAIVDYIVQRPLARAGSERESGKRADRRAAEADACIRRCGAWRARLLRRTAIHRGRRDDATSSYLPVRG